MFVNAVEMVVSIIEERRSKLLLIAACSMVVRGGRLSPLSLDGVALAWAVWMVNASWIASWSGVKLTEFEAL